MRTVCIALISLSLFMIPFSMEETTVEDGVNGAIESIDVSKIDELVESYLAEQTEFLGGEGVKAFIKKIIDGKAIDLNEMTRFILSSIVRFTPSQAAIASALIAVAILFGVFEAAKGKFASSSTESVIRLAAVGIVIALLSGQLFFAIDSAVKTVNAVKNQTEVFFPVLLTLMTAIGANASAVVYRPAVIVFSLGIVRLVSAVAIPLFIASTVFTAVGSMSKTVKLKQMSEFLSSAAKWILGTAFFLFTAFLSVQGITASVYDGISVRTTKYALSKYVPIIGGYLSEGFNLILSGSVLIKNSLGLTAIILLAFTVIPEIINIIMLSLTLKLAAAVTEPIAGGEMSELLSGFSKNVGLLISAVFGVVFLYFLFIMLIIATGNLTL